MHLFNFIKLFTLVALLSNLSVYSQETDNNNLLREAYSQISVGKHRDGGKLLDSLLRADSLNVEALYLKGELYISGGNSKCFDIIEKLKRLGVERESVILNLKIDLLLGHQDFPAKLALAKEQYPENAEIEFCEWLYNLDNNFSEEALKKTKYFYDNISLRIQPYEAAYFFLTDNNLELAKVYLDTLRAVSDYKLNSHYQRYKHLGSLKVEEPDFDFIELPYIQCGPELGAIFETVNGEKLRMAFDTGTSNGRFTIHSFAKGDSLAGDTLYTVKNGIWYGYMDAPVDVVTKRISLKQPLDYEILVEYFEGHFTVADGCFSPFAFPNTAFTFDPIKERVFMRSKDNLTNYVDNLNKNDIEIIPYFVRDSWIYIKAEVNGQEAIMMVESGSRDVNFNALAVKKMNLNYYDSEIMWRGKAYPTKKIDTILKIGSIEYRVEGGLISDYALGNNGFGLAAAGDIGPDFLRKIKFTLDPFNRRIIFEKKNNKL